MDYQLAVATNVAIAVAAGATLTGDGRMGSLTAAGVVAPGKPGVAFATLSATSLSLAASATYAVDFGTALTDADQLDIAGGDVLLGGANLTLNLLAAPTQFLEYVIVDKQSAGPVSGTFAQGATITADFGGVSYPFDILYNGGDGNDVILLTLVPEPGAGVWLLGRRSNSRRWRFMAQVFNLPYRRLAAGGRRLFPLGRNDPRAAG